MFEILLFYDDNALIYKIIVRYIRISRQKLGQTF